MESVLLLQIVADSEQNVQPARAITSSRVTPARSMDGDRLGRAALSPLDP